jgi:esterase/lipase superfamily enzyme
MFIITNREVDENAKGLAQLGDRPNSKGPNELRLAEATRTGNSWSLNILPDTISQSMKDEVGIVDTEPVYASRYVARRVLDTLQKRKRNFLFFVHGYNNDIKDVLNRAHGFQQTYNGEVMAFSWPANGGGARGLASYLSDQRDAQASVPALGRCLEKLYGFLIEFNQLRVEAIEQAAARRHPLNADLRNQYIAQESEKGCPFTVNMILHSMGNYLLKHVLQSSVHQGARQLLFDNVTMAAADANNEDHAEWVDCINCRNRVYITINEDDAALMAARMKTGSQQKARLGHYPFNLYSREAIYINFTDVPKVGSSHAYFEGPPIKHVPIRRFFRKALNGDRAEDDLSFDAAKRLHLFSSVT